MSDAILETEALLEGSKNENLEEQVSSSDGDEQVSSSDGDEQVTDDDDDRIIEINDSPVDPQSQSQSQIISSGISLNISSAPPTDCSSQTSSWSMVHRYREALTKYFTSLHRYEVFLSFRGSDTRKAFTDHLYTALVRASIQTFRDECDLEKGENIKSELYKAIEESRIAIIVFSKAYASSEWCLDELVRILERKKTTGLKVLPVFYDVQPSQIRNHSRNLGKAFSKAEQMDKVQEWKTALKEVADLGGMVLQNESDGHESKFIQDVVALVKSKLNEEASNTLTFKKLKYYIFGALGIVYLVFSFYMAYPSFKDSIKFRKDRDKFFDYDKFSKIFAGNPMGRGGDTWGPGRASGQPWGWGGDNFDDPMGVTKGRKDWVKFEFAEAPGVSKLRPKDLEKLKKDLADRFLYN